MEINCGVLSSTLICGINIKMNKIVPVKVFNDILDQFFDYLEENFPLFRSDIILTRSTTEFIRRSNPRLVVSQFMQIIGPYKRQIYNCDEDFFLNFQKTLTETSLNTQDIVYGLRIKKMWCSSKTTDVQKAHIWLYFQKLVKEGENLL